MEVKLAAGVVVRMIDKEKREGEWPVQGQARLRRWSTGGATGPKLQCCSYFRDTPAKIGMFDVCPQFFATYVG